MKPAENTDKFVEFYDVTKVYPTPKGPLTVVDKFSLDIRKGEFISLIGHSGCGKSTVLSMVAGLNELSGGGIVLDGREVTAAGSRSRRRISGAEFAAVADGARERRARRGSRVCARKRRANAPASSTTT